MRDGLIRKITASIESAGGEGIPDFLEKLGDSLELAHSAATAYCWYVDHLNSSDGELKVLGGMDFWIARLSYELRILERALEDFHMHTKIHEEDSRQETSARTGSEAKFYKVDAVLREILSARRFTDSYQSVDEAGEGVELPLSQGLARIYQELTDLAGMIEHVVESEFVAAGDLSHILMDIELMLCYKTLPRLADMASSVRHQWARVKY